MTTQKDNWSKLFGLNKFPHKVISGPCSVESYEQMKQTITGLQKSGINTIRAGVWKPRTRPNGFEGLGVEGLLILEKLKEELNIKVGVELADASGVEHVLKHGIDYVWIGARTTSSPFAIQEIAAAMRGINMPVFVKNPIAEDLGLWIGGVERVMKNVCEQHVGAIHRGFHRNGKFIYRNEPGWATLKEFRKHMPGVFMMSDPSHIAGDTRYLKDVIDMSLYMNVDAFMIEAHYCPEKALTDKTQQVNTHDIAGLFPPVNHTKDHLLSFRNEIDKLDRELYDVICRRMLIVDEVGRYKREHNLPALDAKRLDEIILRAEKIAGEFNLDKNLCIDIIKKIHDHSRNRQDCILNQSGETVTS